MKNQSGIKIEKCPWKWNKLQDDERKQGWRKERKNKQLMKNEEKYPPPKNAMIEKIESMFWKRK